MLSLDSKTCIKVSRNFLIGSFFLMMLMIVGLLGKVNGFIPLSDLPEGSLMIFYYLSCLLSGLSLIFSTGTHSKILKRTAAIIHFSSVYWFSLLFLLFFSMYFFNRSLFVPSYRFTDSKQAEMASDHFLRDTDDYFNWLFYQAQLRTNPLWGNGHGTPLDT